MKTCPNCNASNREGEFVCTTCGQPLDVKATLLTRSIDVQEMQFGLNMGGTTHLTAGGKVVLEFTGSTRFELELKPKIIIGRWDASNTHQPDVDLTALRAVDNGVSRLHAVMRLDEDMLTLEDMGSSNGTFVNGQRILKGQPRLLRDGDEIRFGKLTAHIYFKGE